MGALVPLLTAALPYLIPAVTFGMGHLVGWFRHKRAAAKAAATTK